MRAREYLVMNDAVEEGVRFGVRRAFKHSDVVHPTEGQMDTIVNEVMNAICERFVFENDHD